MAAKKKSQIKLISKTLSSPKKEKKITKIEEDVLKKSKASILNKVPFHVVAIGASAGGLEAFEEFFKAMPENSGCAFVLISHLDPSHGSILPELIQKKTLMKVNQVVDNMKVAPDQVFIIPPNKEMAILNGAFQLFEISTPRNVNLPIDMFFKSLAQDIGDMAIGIILSGTGTDGTLGMRAIKGEGGIVFAQDIESAKFSGMPASAIATGLIDYTLHPDKMPAVLFNYVKHQLNKQPLTDYNNDEYIQNSMQKIFSLLRTSTQHDFSRYKKNAISRRIERRMRIQQIDNLDNYVKFLQNSDREKDILFKELLIGVTSFFRDPDAFELLKEKYLPDLLFKDKPENYKFRIWVAACSTGEEAYSLAILFLECMENLRHSFSVQIFATDLDEDAIKIARDGIYPDSIKADVSPERLKKFFTKDKNHYRIKKNIREMVVFATQNIIKDPPFTKLDILSCRNLLIYFGAELQKTMMPIFRYSLKPDGLLFLGSSENVGHSTNLFTTVDKKWKIFKCSSSEKSSVILPNFSTKVPTPAIIEKTSLKTLKLVNEINPIKLLKSIILQSDMSTCVVIDDNGTIVFIHGRTGLFLEPAEGEASLNIIEMAKPGLKTALKSAILKMASDRHEFNVKGLKVESSQGLLDVDITLRPLPDLQTGLHGLMMVIFDKVYNPENKKNIKPLKARRSSTSDELKKLEDELKYTKENLQTTIEELEISNEELKSTNEELQSTNEELQSTNEELETSKEELQSLNEESVTVNSELQGRIDELVTVNDDMKNFLDSTEIATIFLDINLKIRRFTAKATQLISLTPIDIGRPITHFATKLKDVDIFKHANTVIRDLGKHEIEVQSLDNHTYRMRITPYRTTNNVIDGVVIVFDDISELKKRLNQDKRLSVIVKDSNDAVTLHDFFGNIFAWNKAAEKMFGYSEEEALKINFFDLIPKEKKLEHSSLIEGLKRSDASPILTTRIRKDGSLVPVWVTITRMMDEKGVPEYIATTERDLTLLNKEALFNLTGENHGR